MTNIVLKWQVPSNQWIYLQRGKIRFMKASAKKLKEERQESIKQQRNWSPVDYELWVWIRYYHGDRRIRDIDNYAKLVLDAMTGIVYDDDSQIEYLYLSKYYDKEFPRVEISIKQSFSSF